MRILGIDYGDARVGFAVCDKSEILASGLHTEKIKGMTEAAEIADGAAACGNRCTHGAVCQSCALRALGQRSIVLVAKLAFLKFHHSNYLQMYFFSCFVILGL